MSDNLYESPVETSTGKYDWSLAKQALFACSMIAILWLAGIVIPAWSACRKMPQRKYQTTAEKVQSFFLDWKSPYRKDRNI